MILKINFCKLLIIEFILFTISENKILFVFQHFRHGARTPSDLFEDDLDLIKEKWNGLKELTNVGLRQSYLLGHTIRNKYPNLINYKKYNPREIEAISTLTNRTIMSARAALIGIYNNTISKKIDESQNDMCIPYYLSEDINKFNINNDSIYPDNYPDEIPVHIVEIEDRFIQLEKICPFMKDLRNKNKERKPIEEFIKKFNETFGEQLLKIFNNDDENYYMDYENVNDICISIIINKFDDRGFKFLGDQIDLDNLYIESKKFFELKTTLVYANDEEGLLAQIGSSILIRKILSYMERIINSNDNSLNLAPKLVLLASHDTAIANMMGILNDIFDVPLFGPYYSSDYVFELEKDDKTNEYSVNLVFNDEILKNIKYADFKKKIINETFSDEKIGNYCQFTNEEESKPEPEPEPEPEPKQNTKKDEDNTTWITIIIIFCNLDAILLVAIGLFIFKIKDKDNKSRLNFLKNSSNS